MSTATVRYNSPTISIALHGARKCGQRGPSLSEQASVFVVASIVLTAAAAALTFHYRVLVGDALSRTYNAASVVYDHGPRLANIGFIWPPLPSLLQIPLVLYKPLASSGFAGPITTALSAALGLVVLNRILSEYIPGRRSRLLLLALYQANPLVLYYSINGMTEIILITIVLACWDQVLRLTKDLPQRNGLTHVALMGVLAGAAFLVRYEGVSFGLSIYFVLVLLVVARGALAITPQLVRGHHFERSLEAFSLAYLAPFGYAIFLWCFFNWLIMGDPVSFMFGRGSNVEQSAALVSGSALFQSMKGNVLLSLAYGATAALLVFPAFYLAEVFLVYLALWKHDVVACGLAAVAASFPLFQVALLYAGQSHGWMRFFIYTVPFGILASTYSASKINGQRSSVERAAFLLVTSAVVVSSATTFAAMRSSAIMQDSDVQELSAILQNKPVDNQAFEQHIASYISRLAPSAKILADDLQADHIILFTMQFERFVTTRDPRFREIAANPFGQVDYVLVPNVPPSINLIVEAHPTIFAEGLPGLELEREFAGKAWSWRLYRVAKPTGDQTARPVVGGT